MHKKPNWQTITGGGLDSKTAKQAAIEGEDGKESFRRDNKPDDVGLEAAQDQTPEESSHRKHTHIPPRQTLPLLGRRNITSTQSETSSKNL